MSQLFVSIVTIAPAPTKLSGEEPGRAPGVTPKMKDGIWAERALAPAGTPKYTLVAGINAVVVP